MAIRRGKGCYDIRDCDLAARGMRRERGRERERQQATEKRLEEEGETGLENVRGSNLDDRFRSAAGCIAHPVSVTRRGGSAR